MKDRVTGQAPSVSGAMKGRTQQIQQQAWSKEGGRTVNPPASKAAAPGSTDASKTTPASGGAAGTSDTTTSSKSNADAAGQSGSIDITSASTHVSRETSKSGGTGSTHPPETKTNDAKTQASKAPPPPAKAAAQKSPQKPNSSKGAAFHAGQVQSHLAHMDSKVKAPTTDIKHPDNSKGDI